ncbi:MAG TPA: sodium:proton antiporter [Solirubrobacterales bacterium]|nr:sodium:proton antiporter [Solirubrobacterales bacterium]
MADLGVIAGVVLVYSLFARPLERTIVTAPMVFVAAGIVAGPKVFDVVAFDITSGVGLIVAELALVIVLFSDASRIDLRSIRGNAGLPARLLGIGMPLTIGAGVIAAALLVTDLDFWEGAVLAAILTPTDAALGKAVITSDRVPTRVRQALNVESGLNDGLAVPILFLFLALAVEQTTEARDWVGFAAEQIGIGAAAGLVIGGVGGWAIGRAVRRRTITPTFEQLAIIALAVVLWAVAGELGGSGFIAAFVGGMVAGRITPATGEHILDFTEEEGELLNLAVFFIFGVAAIDFLQAATWEIALFAVLSLTALRMVPVALALAGTGLSASSIAFIGWFGPRGLASIILGLVVLAEEPELPAIDFVLAAMTLTVLASVLAHGATARPLVRAYARHTAELHVRAPEKHPHPELPTRGRVVERL